MSTRYRYVFFVLLCCLMASAQAQGTTFTYQGLLEDGGQPAEGDYNFRVQIYSDPDGALALLPQPLAFDATPVSRGRFLLVIEADDSVFTGEERWLDLSVQRSGSPADPVALLPRQKVYPSPYAQYAQDAGFAATVAPSSVGTPELAISAVTASRIASAAVGSDQIDATQVQRRVSAACGPGQAIHTVNEDGSVVCEFMPPTGWSLSGNTGTDPQVQFLGTTDFTALEIRTNGQRNLRIQPTDGSPNLVLGAPENEVWSFVRGGTVGGGGGPESGGPHAGDGRNRVQGEFGTVSGGWGNRIGTGLLPWEGAFASIGGGSLNRATASGSTVAGGIENVATGTNAAIGGGRGNEASGESAIIAGGNLNRALGGNSTVAGGYGNSAMEGTAAVGGGASNLASGVGAVVAGGLVNTANGYVATVAGGLSNLASGDRASVLGGSNNKALGDYASIAGGADLEASGLASFVGAGSNNQASGAGAALVGGASNLASGTNSAILGARDSVAMGEQSVVFAAEYACAGAPYSFAGGYGAKVRPGSDPGTGRCSDLGGYPGADGDRGTFLWNDASGPRLVSQGPNRFEVKASGGVRFVTATDVLGEPSAGVALAPGSGAWSNLSDRRAKAGIEPVDPIEVLAGVMALPIYTWHFRAQGPAVRHLGPMAQDFHLAFGLNGQDDRYISSIDPDGVALAAIQGLHALLQTQQEMHAERHQAQQAELEALRHELWELKRGLQQQSQPAGSEATTRRQP